MIFNTGLIFTPAVFTKCKKITGTRDEEPGTMNFDVLLPRSFIVILLITFDLKHLLT